MKRYSSLSGYNRPLCPGNPILQTKHAFQHCKVHKLENTCGPKTYFHKAQKDSAEVAYEKLKSVFSRVSSEKRLTLSEFSEAFEKVKSMWSFKCRNLNWFQHCHKSQVDSQTAWPTKAGEFAHQFIEKEVYIRGGSRSDHSNNVSMQLCPQLRGASIFDPLEVKYIDSFMGTISSAGEVSLLSYPSILQDYNKG